MVVTFAKLTFERGLSGLFEFDNVTVASYSGTFNATGLGGVPVEQLTNRAFTVGVNGTLNDSVATNDVILPGSTSPVRTEPTSNGSDSLPSVNHSAEEPNMTRTRIAGLAVAALLALTATTGVAGAPAGADAFVFPSLSATADGGVTASGDTFDLGNGVILILPASQSCVSGTIEFSPEEAQTIRDEGLDPGRFASIFDDGSMSILTGASYLLNYAALPVSIKEGDEVKVVTSLDPSATADFQTGPLPAGTYNFCLYGIYASAAAYLFDGLVATIGPPATTTTTTVVPTTTTSVVPTTTTTAATETPVTPRYTG